MLNTFHHSYSKTPFYNEAFGILTELATMESSSLLEINMRGIEMIGELLGLDKSKLVRSSTLGVDRKGTDRLVQLVKEVGGDSYLSGDGAGGYQQDELFYQNGLGIQFLGFSHPKYHQLGSKNFFPGLSALDAISNVGSRESLSMFNRSKGTLF